MTTRIAGITGPVEFTIGTTDLARTAAFLSVFGLYPYELAPVGAEAARALYGLDGAARQMILSTLDHVGGTVRLIETDKDTGPMIPFECGPHGFDVFTRDVDLTTAMAAHVGGSAAVPVAWEAVKGQPLKEARILAPGEGFAVYSLEMGDEHRSPSVLDTEPDRQHSNIVMTSWVIPPEAFDAERAFWSEAVGYTELLDIDLGPAEMVDLQLQPHATAMRCAQFADEKISCRVDLLVYPDEPVVRRDDWGIRHGLHSIAFRVDDLEAAIAALPISFSPIVELGHRVGSSRVATGVSPGGIRLELRQAVS